MLINLKDFYSHLQADCIVDVSQEVVNVFMESKRMELNYLRRRYYNNGNYSLDAQDNIEASILTTAPTIDELLEFEVSKEEIDAAIATLSEKQSKRIYAHFILGLSVTEIAKKENVDKSSVSESITQGVRYLKNKFKIF